MSDERKFMSDFGVGDDAARVVAAVLHGVVKTLGHSLGDGDVTWDISLKARRQGDGPAQHVVHREIAGRSASPST